MSDVQRYPLSWPTGWKRTPEGERRPSTFREAAMVQRQERGSWKDGHWVAGEVKSVKGEKKITLPTARSRLMEQLEFLGAQNALVSTNMELTRYGEPRADRAAPRDPGVAVYFELHGKDRVLACDKWDSVAGNVAAIANHIDAIRRVDRYGVGTLDQAFAGYDALPPPSEDNRPPWRGMLGFKPDAKVTADDIKVAYRTQAKAAGNDEGALLRLNLAKEQALKEVGA